MKKSLIIFTLLFTLIDLYAQTEAAQKAQQDWIMVNRANYIGKPFSQLYEALTLKPQSVWGGIAHWNIYIEPDHQFFYRDTANYDDSAHYFYVEWQNPPLKSETQKYQHDMFRAFNAQEYLTYKNLIIKKLEVYPLQTATPPSATEVSYSETSVPVEFCAVELIE